MERSKKRGNKSVNKSSNKGNTTAQQRGQKTRGIDKNLLLRALVSEAIRRTHSKTMLAEALGVSYKRLLQWRSDEAAIATASRSVHEKAGKYLGLPTILILVMAGTISLDEFVWPAEGTLDIRVNKELERLRKDPFLGAFAPEELASASPAMQLFVVFLYQQLNAGGLGRDPNQVHWMRALQEAAAATAKVNRIFDEVHEGTSEGTGIF